MGTYTTNYNLFLPTIGEQGWGDLVNGNFATIDTTMKSLSNNIGTLDTDINAIEERVTVLETGEFESASIENLNCTSVSTNTLSNANLTNCTYTFTPNTISGFPYFVYNESKNIAGNTTYYKILSMTIPKSDVIKLTNTSFTVVLEITSSGGMTGWQLLQDDTVIKSGGSANIDDTFTAEIGKTYTLMGKVKSNGYAINGHMSVQIYI